MQGGRLARPYKIDDQVWALIQACWNQSASRRPTCSQVLASLSPPDSNVDALDKVSCRAALSVHTSLLISLSVRQQAARCRFQGGAAKAGATLPRD